MRVLLTCRDYPGHFLPMAPLAQALLDAGHDVGCATGQTVRAEAERLGLRFFRVGPDQLQPADRAALFPEIPTLAPEEIRGFFFERVFTGYELPLRAAELAGVVEGWAPDVVVHEVAEFAGPLIASVAGIPYATHSYGSVLADDAVTAAAAGSAPHWRAHGLLPHPRAGLWEHLYLDIWPSSLQRGVPAGAPAVQAIRPAERTIPPKRPRRPLVYVTLGTIYNTDIEVFRTILTGLAEEPLDVVVTVGHSVEPAALGVQPDNVRVEQFVPQAQLLTSCSAVVTHGGAGTTLGALSFGLPMLILPQGADQFVNAERVATAGAALWLKPSEVSADSVRVAVRRLFDEPSFRAASQTIADEIAGMPNPSEGASAVEQLITSMTRLLGG